MQMTMYPWQEVADALRERLGYEGGQDYEMTQLMLPRPELPPEAVQAAAKAIQEHLAKTSGDIAELKSDPCWDWLTNQWIALVAVTPWGPLVRMSFGLKRVT